MPSRILDELARRVLVLDGAMGSAIHAMDLDVERDYCGCENCPEILLASRPEVIQGLHERFLEAGADGLKTDSFGGATHILREFDLQDRAFELGERAAQVARAAADKHSTKDRPRFVLGSMGPGTKLITLGQIEWDQMLASYREQARGLIAGGADALLIETCQDLLQVKCAVNAVLEALDDQKKTTDDVPIFVSVTIETTGTMLLGTAIEAAASALRSFPIASLGLNCATGPTEMGEHVAFLAKHWDRHISVVPNAGLPVLHEGKTQYPLGPEGFAKALATFVREHAISIVGGCCGTTPEHITALATALADHRKPGYEIKPRATSAAPCHRPAKSAEQVGADKPHAHHPNEASPAPRHSTPLVARSTFEPQPRGCTSLYSHTDYRQDNSILIVGERCNASGSKKFKQLLEGEDWDAIVSLARSQVREGAHVLDINVDYAGRDNARDMAEVVRRIAKQVDVPLMIDSTQIKTIEAGLRHAAGRCIINSANFEDGEEKFDELCRLAKTFGAALVIGSIDEDQEAAMARTADRKHDIAARGLSRAVEHHGLDPADIFFDPLVLPVSTGMDSDRRSAMALVEGVRRISRAFPDSQITVGLSNASFGLKPAARQVLNSALLHELEGAGLTSAILHAGKIMPRNRIEDEHWTACEDLIYDRRAESAGGTGLPPGITDEGFDPLQRLIDVFKDAVAAGPAKAAAKDLTLEERLRAHIIDGEKEGVDQTLEEALKKYQPLEIINDHLLDGMKTVGELFGSGQMQLPFVLQSAEVMKMAVARLEPLMEKADGQTRGSIVLATVKGDVHDIGKNLVDIILSNNGYTVHNIGIKQPLSAILEKWKDTKADAIGMSGLLVKSVNVMEENLRELNKGDVKIPILLGGAALTRHYAEGHLRSTYQGSLYYGKDAFDGLRIMDHIAGKKTAVLDQEIEARMAKRSAAEEAIAESRATRAERAEAFEKSKAQPAHGQAAAKPAPDSGGGVAVAAVAEPRVRSKTERLAKESIPAAPFLGSRVVTDIDLDSVYPFINTVALFRGQWQFKKGGLDDDAYNAKLEAEILPVFERLKARCRDERLLRPAVVYGYFPVWSDADDLVVFDPTDHEREIERFRFPRQQAQRRLCISDFFMDADECRAAGRKDVLGLSCVTMGQEISKATQELFQANKYQEYLYLHGLGVESAEALAELWHKRMRQELGIAGDDSPRIRELFTQKYRGSRYSFGYPACPDMSDQDILWRLIDPSRIGCVLTENWQIDPEQSTSAIVVHHPEAKYFNV
ncbi:MAG: homocysteine S-methyltransferase family protein [Phycisphaerales bacterium]